MQSTHKTLTCGVHHVGLVVRRLEESAQFFTGMLGWQEVRRDDSYPAIFVSDNTVMLSLWATRAPAGPQTVQAFNKDINIGLHHLALQVESKDALHEIYRRLLEHAVHIEFPPELLRDGPAQHMICYEPSGIRLEFIWPGESNHLLKD